MSAPASNAARPIPSATTSPGGGGLGIARVLAVIMDAEGSSAMARRATTALGLLPSVRWAELDSPWTSGADLLTIELSERGHCLTVALTDPEDDAIAAEVGELLGVIASLVRRECAIEVLTAQARTDALTGLWNRRAFDELMDQGLSRAARASEAVALLVCDVDNFKSINDTLGHDAGDRALLAVADAIRSVTRPSDVAARMGGDEIAIFFAGCDADGARTAAARLRRAVEQANPHASHALTLSMGIADVSMLDAPGPDAGSRTTLLRLADEALYLAKRNGRDTAVTHPGSDEAARQLAA